MLLFEGLVEGVFLSRRNRFLGIAEVNGAKRRIHIHDPGRLRELLIRGSKILLLPKKGKRTDFHLIAVYREGYGWVFTHSGYHSKIVEKMIENGVLPEFMGLEGYATEVRINGHRIDFVLVYPDIISLLEVKGCTLFMDETALFPDAPTERGRKHLEILSEYPNSILMFLIMTDRVKYFTPYVERDPAFAEAFLGAVRRGVHVITVTFSFNGKELEIRNRIPYIYPDDIERRKIVIELESSIQKYNELFSPESRTILSGVLENNVEIVFYGPFCASCALHDYFYDFAQLTELNLKPLGYRKFGNVFVVRYALES